MKQKEGNLWSFMKVEFNFRKESDATKYLLEYVTNGPTNKSIAINIFQLCLIE